MNTKVLSMLGVGILLTACSGTRSINNAELADCPPQGWFFCRGDSSAPTIKILATRDKLQVRPYCINVAERSQLVFLVKPFDSQAEGEVKIIPKNPDHDWLKGTNSPTKNLIVIDVPEDLKPGKYDYGVRIGDRCVDPRVHWE